MCIYQVILIENRYCKADERIPDLTANDKGPEQTCQVVEFITKTN